MAKGRTSKIPDEVAEFVRKRRHQGLSHRAIVRELKSRGTPYSLFTVHKLAPGASGTHGRASPARRVTENAPETAVSETASTGQDDGLPPLPEDADAASIDWWLVKAQRQADKAEADGNGSLWANIFGKIQSALEKKKKWEPPPVERPEDNVDLVRLGEIVAEKFHLLIDDALRAAKEGKAA